jgi:hypothetical protein
VIPGRIAGANIDFGKPSDWDDTAHCATLPVRQAICDGAPVMISAWHPTPDELVQLNAGESVHLMIWGTSHPVVALGVGDVV